MGKIRRGELLTLVRNFFAQEGHVIWTNLEVKTFQVQKKKIPLGYTY